MGIKTVTSSCAVIVLSAVLSTGWAFTSPNLSGLQSGMQGAIDDAADAANNAANNNQQVNEATPPLKTGGERTTTEKNDTNEVMKTNEAELMKAQEDSAGTVENARGLQTGVAEGQLQNAPGDAIAEKEALAAEKEKLLQQKKFCSYMSQTTVIKKYESILITIDQARTQGRTYCNSYIPSSKPPYMGSWTAYASSIAVSPYCYAYVGVQKYDALAGFDRYQAVCLKKTW